MGDCVTPAQVSNFASKDVNRLIGKIAEVLARKTPWINVLGGGTLPAGLSDSVRSVIQERSVLASSLVAPTFVSDLNSAGPTSNIDQVGNTEYSYTLGTYRGRGPRVSVKVARNAFKGAYAAAQVSLEKGILQVTNADIRANLSSLSGVKYVVKSGLSFYSCLAGDMQAISTAFPTFLPDSPLNFTILYKLGALLREDFLADPFETEGGTMFKFIGSYDQIERFRNQLDIRQDLRALVKGRYKIGEESIDGYQFEGPYRGFGFGIDTQPLRYNSLNAQGQPNFIEPEISVNVSNGVASRRNPAWSTATYEIGFLIAADSFQRLIPEDYTGEGTFRFNPQLAPGDLMWHYVLDNDCNMYGDYGWHIYQIMRAYRPVRPHAVIPIAYSRCNADLGIAPCSVSVGLGL